MTSMPKAAIRWIAFVAVVAVVVVVGTTTGQEREGLDVYVALALAVGVAAAVWSPIRYRIKGNTHGITADEAMLVAMLVTLPTAWPPLLQVVGVAVGHLVRRTPRVRLLFNTALVGLTSAAAVVTYEAVAVDGDEITARTILALVAGLSVYSALSTVLMAVLFSRLGVRTFVKGVRELLPVKRVTFPANLLGGLVLAWLAGEGAGFVTIGVGLVVILFVAYRTSVGARQQRDRAGRLRDVSTSLVSASGSFEDFDDALSRIATLFGGAGAEVLLVSGEHRRIGAAVDGPGPVAPSPAAKAGLELDEVRSFPAGGELGGDEGALVAPLVEDGATVGSLVVHGRSGLEAWDDTDEDVIAGVASEVLVALQNAELLEQIAAERSRLAAQSELLGGILTAASDGIALLSVDGEVLAWNPAMSKITGQPNDGIVGQRWSDVLHVKLDGDVDPLGSAIRAASNVGPQARTWRIVRGAGDDRWVRASLTASRAGDRDGVVIVLRDVTAAREVDQLKADFIATVSHELRTPLTPLKGFLELSRKRQLDAEQQAVMNTSMLRQVDRLETLVEDLLSMAQLDRAMVDLAQVPISLEVVASRVAIKYVGEERLTFSVDDVTVIGDLDAMLRVVDALVNNALKHTAGTVQVRGGIIDGQARIDVVDEGPGIAVGDQEAIFERFHRLGDHLHRTQGPGLGLPIARALARRLGGDVTVVSSLRTGSTFTATFRTAD